MNTQSVNDMNHHQSHFHSSSTSFCDHSFSMDPMVYYGDSKPVTNVEGDKTGILFQCNHHIQGPFESVHFPAIPKTVDNSDATIAAAKKMKRTLANRRSARESYLRRKARFADQTALVSALMKQNSTIRAENDSLRLEIEALKKQLRSGALLPNFLGA